MCLQVSVLTLLFSSNIQNYTQKLQLLQKVNFLFLADALNLPNRHTKYDLLHGPQKETISVGGMCWEALPYENAWIEVEYGILLKHETGEPGDKEDKKTKMFVETKVNFKFFSTLVEKGKELLRKLPYDKQVGSEHNHKRLTALHVGKLHDNYKMSSSSDSDDGRRSSKRNKKFHINSSCNPHLLEQMAIGKVMEDASWSQDQKDEYTKKQAKIQMLIMGSLTTRLAQNLMDQKNGTDMWAELCKVYEGRNNDATKALKVYRLQSKLHRTHLRANGSAREHFNAMFRIKNELVELGSPLSDLQMVVMLLRSLPTQLILTAENHSKDWKKSAFGNNQEKKKQGNASGIPKGSRNKNAGDETKKNTQKSDVECFNCGGKGHYKRDCPDLEDKPKKSAHAKMARTGEKPVESSTYTSTARVDNHGHKRDVVLGEVEKRVAKDYYPSR
ncbi:Multidrug resistance protein ABC transporter, partial [Phytophthora megakarya]